MRRGLPGAPKWAWTVIILGVAALGILLPFVLGRGTPDDRPAPGGTAVDPSPPSRPTTTPASTAPPKRMQVLVIGDGFTSGSADGDSGRAGWPSIVAEQLGSEEYDLTVDVSASDGGGYVEPGAANATFGDMARAAGPGYDLVVFFGGGSDAAGLQLTEDAAYAAFLDLWSVLPEAYIMVIGPTWAGDDPPPAALATRRGILAATQQAGVPFVDPIRGGWLVGDSDLVAADGLHPTDAGNRRIADRMLPLLREQLRIVSRTLRSTPSGN